MTLYPKTLPSRGASLPSRRLLLRLSSAAILGFVSLAMAAVQTSAGAEPVRIAVVGPYAGIHTRTVLTLMREARTAAAAHPSGAFAVDLKNDGCDAAVAVLTARAIVKRGYDLVLGHPCPKAALAAAKVYGAAGVAFIATATRHPDLTAKRAGPSIFRLSGRDDAQGLDAAGYLAEAHAGKPVAIVHDRTLYAKTVAEQTAAALKDSKIETITATIVAGDKEYGKLVAKIKDAGAVFFAGFPLEAGFILKEMRASGSRAPFLATETVATPEFAASFPDIAQDVYVLRPLSGQPNASPAATVAVGLYARAQATATGPFRTIAERNALVVAALARRPGKPATGKTPSWQPSIGGIDAITFDAAGNANVNSFGLTRWDGRTWSAQSFLGATAPDK